MNPQLQALLDQARQIRESQAHWRAYQDGSYEMALHHAGYYRIIDQINKLQKETV